jgi:peptidoglycan/xylan/chitin deacetylase (PgdA/CDA1 family)
VNTAQQLVALSFDDGPSDGLTPVVLSILKSHDASATFFVQGDHVEGNESLLRQESDANMEIGNHTWSHPNLTDVSDEATSQEIERTSELLRQDLGSRSASSLFRAPYGLMTASEAAMVRGMGYTPVHWSIPIDHFIAGLGMTPSDAADAIMAEVQPGDILLAHDGPYLDNVERHEALDAIDQMLSELSSRGFRVTDVGQLLDSGTPILANPRTWFWQTGFDCPDP